MKTLIVTGGSLDVGFATAYGEQHVFDYMIAVDKGLEYFRKTSQRPDLIVGDFDSVSEQTKEQFLREKDDQIEKGDQIEIRRFDPHKDYTDTELALTAAIEKGSSEIHLLGATGSRIDHMLGTIRVLGIPMEAGIPCYMIDPCNRLQLINKKTMIKREEQYGKYVSLIPLTDEVTEITLTGFEYPLQDFTMSGYHALGVSNQIVEKEATIELKTGVLILVESKD